MNKSAMNGQSSIGNKLNITMTTFSTDYRVIVDVIVFSLLFRSLKVNIRAFLAEKVVLLQI